MGMNRADLETSGLHAVVPVLARNVVDFETTVVNHPNHVAGMKAIRRLHSRWSPPCDPKRLAARALLIAGESGAGKSTLLKAYAANFPPLRLEDVKDGSWRGKPVPAAVLERLRDGDIIRVVLVEAPKGRTSERAFVAAIFQALGYRCAEHWNTDRIISQIVEYADALGVELFLIDEGHHLVKGRGPLEAGPITEFVKSLLNRLGIPIVIAGQPELLAVHLEDQLGQVSRRSKGFLTLGPYDWWTPLGRARVMGLIKLLEGNLGLPKPSKLWEQRKAARLYVAAAGEPGWISKYLSETLELAIERGLPCLTLDLLGEVHDIISASAKASGRVLGFGELLTNAEIAATGQAERAANPFLCDFSDLRAIWDRRLETVLRRREIEAGRGLPSPAVLKEPGRRTGLHGKGREPISVFGKTG